jgi:hypothetical protein
MKLEKIDAIKYGSVLDIIACQDLLQKQLPQYYVLDPGLEARASQSRIWIEYKSRDHAASRAHQLSLIFNLNILANSSNCNIKATYCFVVESVDILVYSLWEPMHTYLIHATIYNIPVIAIDVAQPTRYSGTIDVLGYQINLYHIYDLICQISKIEEATAYGSKQAAKTCHMSCFTDNLGHYLWNDIGGVFFYEQLLNSLKIKTKVDALVGSHDYLEIFTKNSPSENNIKSLCLKQGSFCKQLTFYSTEYVVLRFTIYNFITQTRKSFLRRILASNCTNSEVNTDSSRSINFLFTLRCGQRKWIKQIQTIYKTCVLIDNEISANIIIDGISRYRDIDYLPFLKTVLFEYASYLAIKFLLASQNIKVQSIIGFKLTTKISFYKKCHLFIQSAGSANIMPAWIMGKQTIVFGSKRMIQLVNSQEYNVFGKRLSNVHIVDSIQDSSECSYVDYHKLFQMISSLILDHKLF